MTQEMQSHHTVSEFRHFSVWTRPSLMENWVCVTPVPRTQMVIVCFPRHVQCQKSSNYIEKKIKKGYWLIRSNALISDQLVSQISWFWVLLAENFVLFALFRRILNISPTGLTKTFTSIHHLSRSQKHNEHSVCHQQRGLHPSWWADAGGSGGVEAEKEETIPPSEWSQSTVCHIHLCVR